MRILALQLKRIGDLILTTPAIAALKAALPEAQLTLGVHNSTAPLLPAIPGIDAGAVFGPGRGWTPWQQALTGGFDAVLDFTGTDRSALAAAMSRAPRRITFDWVRKKRVRAFAFHQFVDSPVRDRHTIDHYLDLVRAILPAGSPPPAPSGPVLEIPATARTRAQELLSSHGIAGQFVIIHPGTARPEKFWKPERWAQTIAHLSDHYRLPILLTGGNAPEERAHLDWIHADLVAYRGPVAQKSAAATSGHRRNSVVDLAGKIDLPTLSALIARARAVLSCDTATVHLAAAFQRPQIALFGPTNPFHWRPRHPRAVVLSAAHPEGPLTEFTPRMKGAPMERLSTELVIHATDALLRSANPAVSSEA